MVPNWSSRKFIQAPLFNKRWVPHYKISTSLDATRYRLRFFFIALRLDWHLSSTTALVSVKFKSEVIILKPNLMASMRQNIWKSVVLPLSEQILSMTFDLKKKHGTGFFIQDQRTPIGLMVESKVKDVPKHRHPTENRFFTKCPQYSRQQSTKDDISII